MDFVKSAKALKSALKKFSSNMDSELPNLEGDVDYFKWSMVLTKIIFESDHQQKSIRKFMKVTVNSLQKLSPTNFESCLSQDLNKIFSQNPDGRFPFSSISFLLEDCPFSRKVLSPYYDSLIERSCTIITNHTSATCSESQLNDDEICVVVKVVLQTVQYMDNDVKNCIQDSTNPTSKRLIAIINSCIIILNRHKTFSSSLRNMCSILIGQILNYDLSDQNISILMFHLCTRQSITKQLNLPEVKEPFSDLKTSCVSDISREDETGILIFLLKGLFSCTRISAFVCEVEDCNFFQYTFAIINAALEFQGESQYHGFQVLKLWWSKTRHILKSQLLNPEFFAEKSDFVQTTLKILFKHWDSPISGVPSIVVDIFSMVIHAYLHVKDAAQRVDRKTTFLENMLDDLIGLPTSVKGKYNFISALVSATGAELVLQKYPNFLGSLTPLLSINHLCPVMSKTYKTIITEIAKCKNGANDLWISTLMPGLMKALLNEDPVIRLNASLYWLPVHLKRVPNAYKTLTRAVVEYTRDDDDYVQKQDDQLLALIAISKVARSENAITLQDVNEDLLHSTLSNFNDSVRSEALLLICCKNKTSEQISQHEMDLVKTYLPLNMNSDSAVFRHQLVYCMKCFAERIRDSVTSHGRKNKKIPETGSHYVDLGTDMLKFILKLCMRSLHVSSTYQRKKTAINIYSTLLSTFQHYFQTFPIFKLLLEHENSSILFHLLQDNTPEIRSQSLSILKCFFQLPSQQSVGISRNLVYNLIRSPRAQDNETGAILLGHFMIMTSSGGDSTGLDSFKSIVEKLKEDVAKMRENILTASYETPVHGWILALCRCLSSIPDFFSESIELPVLEILREVVEITTNFTRFIVKEVFGGDVIKNSNDKDLKNEAVGVSADFCEITTRIERLVRKNRNEISVRSNVLLTENHEVILASCWLCLLRGSSLLSAIAQLLVKVAKIQNILSQICKTYVLILTSCRHRGAIDGCFESFLICCKSLFSSRFKEYRNIPGGILRNVLDGLYSQIQCGSNVTRRSAGIPLIVEAILVAEISCKSDKLFNETVRDIIALSVPVCDLQPQKNDDKYDFPQVHGIYILKHLFRNSQLGSHVLQYAVEVLQIAINCLSSLVWVIRNAATHLFGSVACRMIGQNIIDGSHMESLENSVSSSVFFSRYPEMSDFIIIQLQLSLPEGFYSKSSSIITKKIPLPKPGLHPILSLLSKLNYGKHESDNIPEGLSNIMEHLLGSPVYSVRYLAAKSLLGLTSPKTALRIAANYLEVLSNDDSGSLPSSNILHGRMVFIRFVTAMHIKTDSADLEQIFLKLLRPWLWCSPGVHPMIASECLQALTNFEEHLIKDPTEFLRCAKQKVSSLFKCDILKQAGMNCYVESLLLLMMTLLDDHEASLLFEECILSNHIYMQKAALKWLKKVPAIRTVREDLVSPVTKFLTTVECDCTGETIEVIESCIESWVRAPDHNADFETYTRLCKTACQGISHNSPLSIQCSALKLLSAVAADLLDLKNVSILELDFIKEALSIWALHIQKRTSYCEASEPLRLSASESLEIGGRTVFMHLHNMSSETLSRFVCATLSLLHDEQPDIRRHACSFVSELLKNNGNTSYLLHQNIATVEFLKSVFQRCGIDITLTQAIFRQCFRLDPPEHRTSIQGLLFDKEPFNLYEEPAEVAETLADSFLSFMEDKTNWCEETKDFLRQSLRQATSLIERFTDESMKTLLSVQLCHIIYFKMLLSASTNIGIQDFPAEIEDVRGFLYKVLEDKTTHTRMKREVNRVLSLLNST